MPKLNVAFKLAIVKYLKLLEFCFACLFRGVEKELNIEQKGNDITVLNDVVLTLQAE